MSKKFPFYKQEGINDCAAAVVLMILKYYKGNISHLKLTERLKTSRKGTTAFHIIETLKYLGFHAEGIKTDINHINILPAIAHVIIENTYKHYVVIYKINYQKKYVILADPAKSIKKYPFEEFQKIWTGVIIQMYPSNKIFNQSPGSLYKYIFKIAKPHKQKLILIGFLSFFITIISIIISFSFQVIMNTNLLVAVSLLFTLLTIFKILLEYLRNKLLIKLNVKIDYYLSTTSFEKIINLPYSYYQGRRTGDIVSRINDLKNVRDLISTGLIDIFSILPLMILSGIFLFFLNHILFFITILILIAYIIIIIIFRVPLNNMIDLVKQKNADNTSYMVETIEGFETIKGLNIEKKACLNFKKQYISYTNDTFKLNNIYNKLFFWKDLINGIGNLLIIIVGLFLVKNGFLDLGFFISFVFLSNYFLTPIRNLVDVNLELREVLASLRRIMDITFNEYKEGTLKVKSTNYIFKHVNYSFDDIKLAVKDINLELNKNEKIIILGPSGSGKSTFLKLMMKYYTASGQILIDNLDINNINSKELKNKVIYISQNEKLFTGTLLKNLTLAGNKNLKKIIEICYLNEIIDKDSLGLYQLIEENGFNLSGGQRQRIILARALLRDFDYLLIDEGLNEMDISLERKILKNLFKFYKDKTIIIVSHRSNNLDLFDRLIKFENKHIISDLNKNKGEKYAKNEQ